LYFLCKARIINKEGLVHHFDANAGYHLYFGKENQGLKALGHSSSVDYTKNKHFERYPEIFPITK
jgi:hypothetical protein